MSRVPPASPEAIPAHLHDAFEMATKGHTPTGMRASLLYSPEASHRAHHWADYLRTETGVLTKRIQELAMLVVARELDCPFIWNAHARIGRDAGLSSQLVDALRDKKPLSGLRPDEKALIGFGQEWYRTRRVSQNTFDEVHTQFGAQGVAELVMLMGFYAMLAFNAAAFGLQVPPGHTETLLPV
mgnify:CR=1 FL=1